MEKVKVDVVKATQEHIDYMKPCLRNSDKDQCWAIAHITAEDGLQMSFDKSALCWVALIDEHPIICWGVARETLLSKQGVPWFSATNELSKLGFRVVRHSKEYFKRMFRLFDRLETWVDARNKISMAWLRWCGFTMEAAIPLGPDGMLFHKFWAEKQE